MSARYPSRWLSAAALLAAVGLNSTAAAQSPPPAGAPQPPAVPALLPLPRLLVEPLLLEQEQVTEHGPLPRATPAMPAPPAPHTMHKPGQPECRMMPAEEMMLRCLLFSIHPFAAFLPIELEVEMSAMPFPGYLEHPPQYLPPGPAFPLTHEVSTSGVITSVPVAELLGLPHEAERLDVMPVEVEPIKVMPAAEESELKYELLGPWTDSARVLSLPLLPLAEIKVGVQEAKTGALMFGVGAELSRTGTVTVSAEPLAPAAQSIPLSPTPAAGEAGPPKTQVMLNVMVAEVDRKGARALKLDRAADDKAARWVIEVVDESRQAAFVGSLKGLREKSHAKVVAEPRLVTFDGQQASFLSGGQQAIPVASGAGPTAVQFMDFGTQITCRPVVLADGTIHLDVEPEISELCETAGVTVQGTVVPGRSSQRVHTTADIAPGRTLVISGPKAGGDVRLAVLVTPTVVPPPAATDAARERAERRTMVLMNYSGPSGHEVEAHGSACQPSHLTPERVHGGVGGDEDSVHDLLVKCQRELSRGHFAAAEDLAQQAISRDRKQVEDDPLVCQFNLLQKVKAAAVLPLGTVPPCECKPQGRRDAAPANDKAIGSDDRMVEALMNEYNAAYREARYRDAAAVAQRVLQIDPDNAVATGALNLAWTQARLRPAAPAPEPMAARLLPAVVTRANGTRDQPRQQADDAMVRFCDHFKQGRYEEAKAAALQALSAAPDDASALAALQMACAAMAKQPHPTEPQQCPYVGPMRPLLPPVDPAVVSALQKILIDPEKGPAGGAEEAEPKVEGSKPTPRR